MSAQGHTQNALSTQVALARDLSVLLSDEIAPIFRRGGTDVGPTDFQGAFQGGAVNQYGSGLHDEDEDEEGPRLLPKFTSLSSIVPVGVQLDDTSCVVRPAASRQQQQQQQGPPTGLWGRQAQPQRLKQSSQQRGPGRPAEQPKQAQRPHDMQPAAEAPGPSTGNTRRAASEPRPEPSFGPVAAASPPDTAAAAPAGGAAKKPIRFKVKLGGKHVGTVGGSAAPSLGGSPLLAPALEPHAIVDTMCGLGAIQLLSPIPSHWGRVIDGVAEPMAASEAPLQLQKPHAVTPAPQSQAAAVPPHLQQRSPSPFKAVSMEASPVEDQRAQSPFAALAGHSPAAEPQAAPASLQQREAVPSVEGQPAAAHPGGPAQQQVGAGAKTTLRLGSLGPQSVLSPVPSLWSRLLESPAGPLATGSAAAEPTLRPEPRTEASAQQATARPASRAVKRNSQDGGGDSEEGGAGAPAPKRPRSASAEPSQGRHSGDAQRLAAARRQGSVELTPVTAQQQQQARQQRQTGQQQVAAPGKVLVPHAAGAPKPESKQPRSASNQAGQPRQEAEQPHHAPQQQQHQRVRAPTPTPQQAPRQEAQLAQLAAAPLDDSMLGGVAAALNVVLQAGADSTNQPSSNLTQLQVLQDEGRRLKRFAEKKMVGDRHTHVSCTFLLSSGLKFLAAAGIMDANPRKFNRESCSTMYSQTAAMLESCAHAALRAEGPALAFQGVALLAERLGAVSRLRAAHCMRNELTRDAAAFRTAVESAHGETFQRPSPTDSNVSATVTIPLEGGSPGGELHNHQQQLPQQAGGVGAAAAARKKQQGGSAASSPSNARLAAVGAGGGKKRGADEPASGVAAGAAAAPPLLVLPKRITDRELGMAGHMQGVMAALSALGRSSERLREYLGKAAAEGNAHAMKAAAGASLLSADAGMGKLDAVLNVAREALDAAMKIEA